MIFNVKGDLTGCGLHGYSHVSHLFSTCQSNSLFSIFFFHVSSVLLFVCLFCCLFIIVDAWKNKSSVSLSVAGLLGI